MLSWEFGIVGWRAVREMAGILEDDMKCRDIAETILRREIDPWLKEEPWH